MPTKHIAPAFGRHPHALATAHDLTSPSKKILPNCASGGTGLPERLVLCGGAGQTKKGGGLQLALHGRSQNIRLKLDNISTQLVKNIPDLLIDLIEVASYVYSADQATSQFGTAQPRVGSGWRRSFRFVIPVRNPDHWNSDTVIDLLCDMLSFLSDDDYAFEFVE
jgi:hypothetical protein